MKQNKYIFIKLSLLAGCALCLVSCKKYLEADAPIERYTGANAYSSTPAAVAAITGIYLDLSNNTGLFGRNSSGVYGLLSDELTCTANNFLIEVYRNTANTIPTTGAFMWETTYRNFIYRCNSVIEGVSTSVGIPDRPKQILVGEARFTRALMYFYLVNFYGDVPLVTSTDYKKNSDIARTPKGGVYEQIITDLKKAQESLSDNFLNVDLSSVTTERVRPNRMAATALLARVYLYLGRWSEAEIEASKIISDVARFKLVDLDNVFLKNSDEAIWQLQPDPTRNGGSQQNTRQADFFIPNRNLITNIYSVPDVAISSFLKGAFEPGDQRLSVWMKEISCSDGKVYTIPFKYKVAKNTGAASIQSEYTMILRLSEQYLIRAEARAKLGIILGANGAQADLNTIRKRAGLGEISVATETEILAAIDQERFVELFTEFGHRWLDLKRRETINTRMQIVAPSKGGIWNPSMALLGIPYNEFKYNPSLIGHQNAGYSEAP
ncbi:RagB/SusD family nutrient uptake outer membrane protein [Pedobacter faecalis]|uniref:RagB/SusD family nutrient uptake outer membrane protein n=1 Tax=Pedobacter faecalis TaxID=3041495 RepID=UPI00254C599C|nr:RagB/SusD family nutrient uptake outer membrane protein [Pedobacter sp. ELA7]